MSSPVNSNIQPMSIELSLISPKQNPTQSSDVLNSFSQPTTNVAKPIFQEMDGNNSLSGKTDSHSISKTSPLPDTDQKMNDAYNDSIHADKSEQKESQHLDENDMDMGKDDIDNPFEEPSSLSPSLHLTSPKPVQSKTVAEMPSLPHKTVSPAPSHPEPDVNSTIEALARNLSNQEDKPIQACLRELVDALPKDRGKVEISSKLQKNAKGEYKVEPFTLNHSDPRKICYKINVTYTLKVGDQQVEFTNPIYTTATQPEKAILAASVYKKAMKQLALEDSRLNKSLIEKNSFRLSLNDPINPSISYGVKSGNDFEYVPLTFKKDKSKSEPFVMDKTTYAANVKSNQVKKFKGTPGSLPQKEVRYQSKEEVIRHRGYQVDSRQLSELVDNQTVTDKDVETLKSEIDTLLKQTQQIKRSLPPPQDLRQADVSEENAQNILKTITYLRDLNQQLKFKQSELTIYKNKLKSKPDDPPKVDKPKNAVSKFYQKAQKAISNKIKTNVEIEIQQTDQFLAGYKIFLKEEEILVGTGKEFKRPPLVRPSPTPAAKPPRSSDPKEI